MQATAVGSVFTARLNCNAPTAFKFGEFDRTLTLPIAVDPDGVKAEYRDGVLAIFIPRAEADKPRSIKIN